MPKIRAGTASWAGAIAIGSATYTNSHGATPAQATVAVLPTDDVPNVTGTLVITDGIGTVTLTRCRIAGTTYTVGQNGRTLNLFIFDRRWLWAYPKISGKYNVPRREGPD
jgi:hypothetical protein